MTRRIPRWGRDHRIAAASCCLFAASLVGLGCPDREQAPVQPPDRGPRIISVSPLATRFLTGLGLADRIVPIDLGPGDPVDPIEWRPGPGDWARLDPDFVFLPELPEDRTDLAELEAIGARIVEFAPHDLEDLLALLHGIGVELAGEAAVEAFERGRLRPVALIAGESQPTNRLRTVALVGLDPPELAGGHSVETDLIEIAGATSLTHGADDDRRPIDRDALAAMKPDLILVMTEAALDSAARERVLDLAGGVAPIAYFEFARETFWLDEPVREARRLRDLVVAAESGHPSPAQP